MKITTKQSEKNLFVPVELTITFESRNEILGMLAYTLLDGDEVIGALTSGAMIHMERFGFDKDIKMTFDDISLCHKLQDILTEC